MRSRGAKTTPSPPVLRHASKESAAVSDFCSYEDASWAMVHAAEVSEFDNQHIQVLTPTQPQRDL